MISFDRSINQSTETAISLSVKGFSGFTECDSCSSIGRKSYQNSKNSEMGFWDRLKGVETKDRNCNLLALYQESRSTSQTVLPQAQINLNPK